MNSASNLTYGLSDEAAAKSGRPTSLGVRHAAIWLCTGFLVTSCVNPNQPNAGYFALDQTTVKRNRACTHAIEDDSQQFRHRERMSRAAAAELATRNAPRVIYHTGIFVPY